jgi:hypothetical protein
MKSDYNFSEITIQSLSLMDIELKAVLPLFEYAFNQLGFPKSKGSEIIDLGSGELYSAFLTLRAYNKIYGANMPSSCDITTTEIDAKAKNLFEPVKGAMNEVAKEYDISLANIRNYSILNLNFDLNKISVNKRRPKLYVARNALHMLTEQNLFLNNLKETMRPNDMILVIQTSLVCAMTTMYNYPSSFNEVLDCIPIRGFYNDKQGPCIAWLNKEQCMRLIKLNLSDVQGDYNKSLILEFFNYCIIQLSQKSEAITIEQRIDIYLKFAKLINLYGYIDIQDEDETVVLQSLTDLNNLYLNNTNSLIYRSGLILTQTVNFNAPIQSSASLYIKI